MARPQSLSFPVAAGHPLRGIRGAVSVERDDARAIVAATERLLNEIVTLNRIGSPDRIAGLWLSATPDLNSAFPARAVRRLGWRDVPVLCMQEIPVPGAPPRIIRALMLAMTPQEPGRIRHPYLGRAARLRPDRAKPRSRPSGPSRGTRHPRLGRKRR